MKLLLILAVLLLAATPAAAQNTVPDLKGMWSGVFKSVVYGSNPHHPGTRTTADSAQVREVKFTLDIEGQDGRLAWGKSWSSNPSQKEPFALALSVDGKTAIGADLDGHHLVTLLSADRMEHCYTHTGLGATKSIVAACGIYTRVK
jgi:hypothetical protein